MKIDFVASPEGCKHATDKIKWYTSNMSVMQKRFVDRLLMSGYKVVQKEKQEAKGDSDISFVPQAKFTNTTKNVCRATLSISGKDVLFVEFGAGVHYNGALGSTPNPKGLELGYFIGSYPEQTHAGDDYWFYTDESGKSHFSQGTKAGMPMYLAAQYMRGHIGSIAREVFGTNG